VVGVEGLVFYFLFYISRRIAACQLVLAPAASLFMYETALIAIGKKSGLPLRLDDDSEGMGEPKAKADKDSNEGI
jgi:hypothetical protein